MKRRLLLALLVPVACAARGTDADAPAGAPIAVEGNREVASRDLLFAARRELQAFQSRGRRASDLSDAAYAMERVLLREGFAHGEVRFETDRSADAIERVRFVVAEGPRALLGPITFTKEPKRSPEALLSFFVFKKRSLLGSTQPVFDRAALDERVGDLETSYLRDGYYRVAVGPAQVTFNDERTVASVAIPVREGPQFRVTEVVLEGVPDQALFDELDRLLRDRPYSARLPAETAALAQARLRARGHLAAQVSSEAEIAEEGPTVRITLVLSPGPLFRLRHLEVEGLGRTRKRFVRSRLRAEKGEILDQNRIDASVDDLYRSGLFRTVRARADAGERDGEEVDADLVIAVEELLARAVSFEAGWGSYELLRGGVRYEDRNLLGLGRLLGVEANGSLKGYGALARVSDNYLFGRANTVRLSTSFLRREEPTFVRAGTRFDLSMEHRFEGPFTLSGGYVFDVQEATEVTGVVAGAEEGGFVRTAGLFLGLERDTRDNRLLPAEGSLADVGIFWSAPTFGAELDFVELRGSWARYRKFGEHVVLALGARFATREILDGRATLPVAQRLFLGGESSVRSFRQDELGPSNAAGEPLGGLTAAEAHAELRVRVWRELHAALFYDVGTVGAGSWELPGPPGHAVGIGLRYHLPVGPVRIDFGYNPGRRFAADDSFAIHFAFGFSF